MSDVEQARTLFFEALDFLDASGFQAAEARLRQALRLSPDNPAILTNLSVALLQQGRRTDACEFAAKAIVADPRNVEALLVLPDGRLTEGSHTSLFGVLEGELVTAPNGPDILPGVTRGLLFRLAEGTGVAVRERNLHREELAGGDPAA